MRLVLVLCLALLAACSGGKVQSSVARVRAPAAVVLTKTYVGETSRTPILVEAIGTAPVKLTELSLDAPGLSLEDPAPRTIDAGTSVTLQLVWHPEAPGPMVTTLHLRTDVEDAPVLDVPLTGEAREKPDCDDHNPCTDDTFDRQSETCGHHMHSRACDDGNACTTDDRCVSGTCRGRALTCDDGDVCTLNLCDPTKGCVFPPDGRQCDDGDPCTKDVCDRSAGCSHPNADDGTACGAFSCATAHLCVFGKCRTLDVTGSSDGFPCFDGDLCTENDACQDGECVGGERLESDPTVLATIETFGGHGDFLASDGFRFVFAGPHDARFATRDGSGSLVVDGALDVPSTAPPALAGPGMFLFAAGSAVTLVDATDTAHPALVWSQTVAQPASGAARTIRQVWKVDHGLLILASRQPDGDELLYVPVGAPPAPLGTPRVVFSGRLISDADCDGERVVVASEDSLRWFQLGTGGAPTNVVLLHWPVAISKVTVLGNRVALEHGGMIEEREVAPAEHVPLTCQQGDAGCRQLAPGCDGTFENPLGWYATCDAGTSCPQGNTCRSVAADACPMCDRGCPDACCQEPIRVCFADAPEEERTVAALTSQERPTDLTLTDQGLFAAFPSGVASLVPTTSGGASTFEVTTQDPIAARGLERAPGLLLSWGDIALPFTAETLENEAPALTRITGRGHGDVVAVADDAANHLVLAGSVAEGRFDPVSQSVTEWQLSSTTSGPMHPRVLLGRTFSSLVDLHVGGSRDPVCSAVPVEVLDASTLTSRDAPLCSLDAAHLELVGSTLISAEPAAGTLDNGGMWDLKSWELSQQAPAPTLLRTIDSRGLDDLRMTADGSILGFSIEDATHIRVQSFSPARPTEVHEYTFEADASQVNRWMVAADGPVWLASDGPTLSYYTEGPAGLNRETTQSTGFSQAWSVRSMRGGRIWMSAESSIDGTGYLVQMNYDPADPAAFWSRSPQTRIPLTEPVTRVHDAGAFTVATSNHHVKFIRPACRR